MKIKITILVSLFLILVSFKQDKKSLPEGFVYATAIIPDLVVELRYYSTHNFVGDTIEGYHANKLIVTKQTAEALKNVQNELLLNNLCLKVFDGYRPQEAVNHFMTWAKDLNDTINKQQFYPEVKKKHLFQEGYIASKSGHSRGSTLDLTIIDANTHEALDMGSPYDFFGEASWVNYPDISDAQKTNRQLLQTIMLKHGFRNYPKEWWHFTLRHEPFPDTYFNFPVE
ncbi:M15 family metallopeptidase [Xanthomarina spongicola]|uniref:D-alanyl-D-alanine dipeptidase n=1 Tax=Xanthomarina spongicola TaxID=570520 RepID=A0A316DMG4_9FLAO|nr:M15 family metallopeptidase [Xanthomarina spongicola]PWK18742.1 D-alanyl-D-alanine dipeptidase [Xanthomarina spongicola]